MIRQVLKVFKALNSNEKPWQLSLGLAFGGIIGLMPLWTPHNIVLLFLAFIINLNLPFCSLGFSFSPASHTFLTLSFIKLVWRSDFRRNAKLLERVLQQSPFPV